MRTEIAWYLPAALGLFSGILVWGIGCWIERRNRAKKR
jgi:hypothetical protein